MTDTQHSKGKFWLGVFFISLGIAILSPLIYRSPDSFKDHNIVGPLFGICLGLTFLIVGILRISKSRRIDEDSTDNINSSESSTSLDYFISSDRSSDTDKPKTPAFIKLVAWSPAIPLCILLIAQAGCDVFGLNTCREHYSFMEAMAYLGGLGWIASLPIAGMLKMIHSAAN